MNLNYKNYNPFLILIPALAAFFVTLIPTLNHQWPLSWDIIYHVEYARIYSDYGFAFQKTYPPLFHLLLAFLGIFFKTDYFQIAKALQPILAFSVVLSVSYVSKKFYGNVAGISTGFLIVSSYMFYRLMMPLPETLALIFLIFSIYFYYISISKKNIKYAFISGILLILTLATHRNVPMFLVLAITIFTLLELFIYKNKSVLKNYSVFLSSLIVIIVLGTVALLLFKPDLLSQIMQQGTSTYLVYFISSTENKPITIFKYIAFVGILVTLFSFIGSIVILRTKQKLGIFLLLWIFAIFLISESHWFGFSVDTVRFLVYILIPLSILGGFGLDYVYDTAHSSKRISAWRFKSALLTGTFRVSQSLGLFVTKIYKRFSAPRFRSTFLMSIFILSLFFGLLATEKPFTFYAENPLGNVQIAPPSASEADLAYWFNLNGDKRENIIISNRYSGIFISAETGMKINPHFGSFSNNNPKSTFDSENIGYIVYDKRLSFPFKDNTANMVNGGSGLFYYSKDSNIYEIIPDFATVIYENNDFIICKIE